MSDTNRKIAFNLTILVTFSVWHWLWFIQLDSLYQQETSVMSGMVDDWPGLVKWFFSFQPELSRFYLLMTLGMAFFGILWRGSWRGVIAVAGLLALSPVLFQTYDLLYQNFF